MLTVALAQGGGTSKQRAHRAAFQTLGDGCVAGGLRGQEALGLDLPRGLTDASLFYFLHAIL